MNRVQVFQVREKQGHAFVSLQKQHSINFFGVSSSTMAKPLFPSLIAWPTAPRPLHILLLENIMVRDIV